MVPRNIANSQIPYVSSFSFIRPVSKMTNPFLFCISDGDRFLRETHNFRIRDQVGDQVRDQVGDQQVNQKQIKTIYSVGEPN